MPLEPDVSLEPDNTIRVRGCLDVETVASYRDAGLKLCERLDDVVIDLKETEARGSAAVALLIAWLRATEAAGKSLSIRNAPESLLAIAEACGVDEIIPFAS